MIKQISFPHLVELYAAIKSYVLENILYLAREISNNLN